MTGSVDAFNRLVAETFRAHRVAPPVRFVLALDYARLLDWPQYTEMLFDLALDRQERQRIRAAYEVAGPPAAPPDHLAAAGSEDSELRCANEREFTRLLKDIQLRSGLSPAKIGEMAGIPRSQAYSMVARGTLPTRFRQVARFVEACGLPEPEIRHVLRLWLELRQRGYEGEKAEILWVDYLDHLCGGLAPDGDPSPAETRSRRLSRLKESTYSAERPVRPPASGPARARRT
ncbi:helix-turn-helix domain-containing protein [Saccharothrix sp. HUAS TT1]|uniref:helix-turn-helix domain-containing protein n=1 Tax=unclassified Saccharothrix TaxID=2593673 RepID=UPI00345B4DA4